MAVETRADLKRWEEYLNRQGVLNSGVLRGILGWLLVFKEPDGLSLRLYSNEQHEFDALNSDIDSPWVVYPAEC